MNVRENWRIILLVVFVLFSALALFVPGGLLGSAGASDQDPTNLNYGIDLAGGIRIEGTLVGMTAENANVTVDNANDVRQSVAGSLGVDRGDVEVRPTGQTVEVFNRTDHQAFADALQSAGVDVSVDDIRDGVTAQTRQTSASVLDRKIDRTGLGGGGAFVAQRATGQAFIQIKTPETNLTQVRETITRQGQVQTVAYYPTEGPNGSTVYRETPLFANAGIEDVQQASQGGDGGGPNVGITLRPEAAQNFSEAMQRWTFARQGGVECRAQNPREVEDPGYCLMTVVDGEVTWAGGMSEGLATDIRTGTFLDTRSMSIQTSTFEEAQQVKIDLETGALSAPFEIEQLTQTSPATGERFKLLSVVTALAAWLALSGVVFLRYRQLEVAIPMLLTAAAEVFILLGFAATVQMALNLGHIAGFIAVIGTGVDDLVIIADEILQEGEVATGRVFQNRFRKAFWVIGAAAATTIVAMSPLIALGLGDLAGFAIVTIVGVLIGVLVTRPAYGDVLRSLLVRQQGE